jgi:uncharacterized protein YcbX
MERIGTLRHLRRYPVKGMRGEDLMQVQVNSSGIAGDRVFALIDETSTTKNFPWMTPRQRSEMVLFRPRFVEGDFSRVEIKTPEGETLSFPGEEFVKLLEKRFSRSLTLRFELHGMKDSRPLSLISMQTIEALSSELGLNLLSLERFRANFYADWENGKPYFENDLIGRTLKIGDAEVKFDKRNSRCVVPTLDPDTAASTARILQKIEKDHDGCVGIYALTEKEGLVKNGDSVYLL